MTVINRHKRHIHQPREKIAQLFASLATNKDLVWPYENWPAMRFKNGLKVGSKGGHGSIRYTIIEFKEGKYIKFQFSKPDGFYGTHELSIIEKSKTCTDIVHEIHMKTSFKATLLWIFIIRSLHDALIEDAFDKMENYFNNNKKETNYSFWVKLLREVYIIRSFQIKHT